MIAGHLQEKKGLYYMVLSYKDKSGKRVSKWLPQRKSALSHALAFHKNAVILSCGVFACAGFIREPQFLQPSKRAAPFPRGGFQDLVPTFLTFKLSGVAANAPAQRARA